MSIKFYEHPLSPYARKVKIVMHEKEIPFEAFFVSPSAGIDDAAMREFAKISPRLEVPCLADGPTAISDSTIMLDYLDEKYPDPPMLPASPEERARVRMLEEICDTEIEAVLWGLFEIRIFGRAQGEQAEAMAATAGSQLRRLWGRLERELSGREWLSGNRFGRGDAAAYPHVAAAKPFGFAPDDAFPLLTAWAERCAARESVKRERKELSAWMKASGGGTAGMPIIRRYRDHRLEWMMKSGGIDIVLKGLDNGTIGFAHEHA